MASRVESREQEEYDEETEEITINGTSAVVKVNLPSKSKLSQWCQISKKEFPVYSVAFLDRGDYSKHVARVTVDGVQAFGSASKKIRAEAAAAYKLLSGVRLLEGDAVEVGLQTDFYAGEQVPSNKIMVSNNTKRRRQERIDQFNANKRNLQEKEEAAVSLVEQISQAQPHEHISQAQPYEEILVDEDGVICMDIERSGGPEDSEIIQLAYSSRSGSGNSFIVPEGNIDPYTSNNCHKLFKRGSKLYKNNAELPSVTMEAAAKDFIKYLEGIANPVIVCYGSCDWVTLMNNFAQYGLDEKLAKTIRGVLDFQAVVTDEPSLNKGSISLVKLDTPENLTERVLGDQISRDELMEGAHDARFDTDILMRVFRQYMKSFDKDLEELLASYMLRSQNLADLAETKVNRIMIKRMRKGKEKQLPFKVFNGWM